jgi:hypothetical protein
MTELPAHGDCSDVAAYICKLINQRKFRRALRLCDRHAKDPNCDNAQFWFQFSLVCRLTKQPKAAGFYHEVARDCPNYTPELEEAFRRDEALTLLRNGQPDEALKIVEELEANQPEEVDSNRKIVLIAVKARILDATNDRLRAWELYDKAYSEWIHLGALANQQWQANNLFHMFRHAMQDMSIRRRADVFTHLYDDILLLEPSLSRRRAAKLMWHFGRLGVWVVDHLAS